MPSILYGFTDDEISVFPGTVLEVTPEGSSELSPHPVEDGTSITDHVSVKPPTLAVKVHVSPAVLSGPVGDVQEAFGLLRRIQAQRVLCTINSDVATFEEYALTRWSAPRTREEGSALVLDLEFGLVRIVSTQTTAAPTIAPTRRRAQRGAQTPDAATAAQRAAAERNSLALAGGRAALAAVGL